MLEADIPGHGKCLIEHLVIDLNGTLAQDGELVSGVAERLERLAARLSITVVTADTRGNADTLVDRLPVSVFILKPGQEGEQKCALVHRLGRGKTVAIGNGANDAPMLRRSLLGICVLGREGAAAAALRAAHVMVTDVNDALDLLLSPRRLVATLRR
ncbi:MAG TPA: ATPase P [Firmicutes bacterium]|nr:ATPase P [Bacillota bacterium]